MRMNIEAERSRNGLTKTELAQALGISINTYNEYIKDAPIPSSKLCAMADMFQVTTDYLLGRKEAG